MMAVPELSRMIQEFEDSNNQTDENDYHEQKSGVQNVFCKDILNTLSSFKNLAAGT